jgi:histidine triad (HIT) family protein
MDIQPVNNGHVLVVPRQHYDSIFEVPPELGVHLFKVTMELAGAVRKVTGCEDMNIVVSSGEAAGQDEPHYHVHIIPRRVGDGFDIPLPFGGSMMPARTRLDAYAAQIVSALRDPMRIETPTESPPSSGAVRRDANTHHGASARLDTKRSAERPVALTGSDDSDVTARGATPTEVHEDVGVYFSADEGAHGELRYEPGVVIREAV